MQKSKRSTLSVSKIIRWKNKELDFLDEVQDVVRKAMEREHRRGYIIGIKAAAGFAGTWDQQITGTEFRFEDMILLKFNLLGKRKPRRKVMRLRTLAEKAEIRVKSIVKLDDEYLKGIMNRRPR